MSQPDYIDILRIAKSMGIEPSPSKREPKVDSLGNPTMAKITESRLDELLDELEMCQMIIQHFDNQFRKMQQSLNQAQKNMGEIARFRLSWMTGGIPSDSKMAKGLPKEWFDNNEVIA